MVLRLPTHLESFVPPPTEQLPATGPWRGSIALRGFKDELSGSDQVIRISGVETDGDIRVDLWPAQLIASVTYVGCPLTEVQNWVRRHRPPLCTFLPDRLRDPAHNHSNQTYFRSFAQTLIDNQTVAVCSWNAPDRLPGSGIIIFPPPPNLTAILVGAIFLSSSFPEFLAALLPHPFQMQHEPPPSQPPTNIGSTASSSRSAAYRQAMLPPSSGPSPSSAALYDVFARSYSSKPSSSTMSGPVNDVRRYESYRAAEPSGSGDLGPQSLSLSGFPSSSSSSASSSHGFFPTLTRGFDYSSDRSAGLSYSSPTHHDDRGGSGRPGHGYALTPQSVTTPSSSSTDPAAAALWPLIKDEDERDLYEFTTSLRNRGQSS